MGRKLIDLSGRSFGRLAVVALDGVDDVGGRWMCKCQCGSVKVVHGHLLRRGQVKSCGCLKREVGRQRVAEMRLLPHPRLRHGESRLGRETAEWRTWHSIKQRCSPEVGHPDYAGRGIRICEEWRTSYETFLAHVGRRPSQRHSIDRINVDGHYEPGNVRWATKKEQARNRRTSRFIVCGQERRTLAEWGELTGVKIETIRERLRRGWSVERALGWASRTA